MLSFLPSVALVLAMFLWGSSFVALKHAFNVADPWWIIWARMCVATLLGFAFLRFFPRFVIRREDWMLMLVMGLFEPCLYFIFETLALQYTSAAQAGAITAVLPLFIGIAAAIFLSERPGLPFIVGVVVSFGGAVWLSLGSAPSAHATRPWLGNLFEVLAMLSAAGYVMAVKKLSARYSAWHLVLVQNTIGALFFAPMALRSATTRDLIADENAPWLAVFYLGGAVSLGAFLCYNFALKHMAASRAAAFTYLIPVFAAGMSVVFLGERIMPHQIMAIALVLGGVVIAEGLGGSVSK